MRFNIYCEHLEEPFKKALTEANVPFEVKRYISRDKLEYLCFQTPAADNDVVFEIFTNLHYNGKLNECRRN